MAEKVARKKFAPRKAVEKKPSLRKPKKEPTITKVGEVHAPVGALADPALKDVLSIRKCINCGQDSQALQFDVSEGSKPEDVKINCPKCKHTWTVKEEKSPHRLL
jgi:hypothetical protein